MREISRIARRLLAVGATVAALALYLLARERAAKAALVRAQRTQSELRNTRAVLQSKESQHEASARAAHTQSDLVDRLRSGAF